MSNIIKNIKNSAKALFGYNIVENTKYRKQSSGVIKNEDKELSRYQRSKVITTSQDQIRNFAVAGWMVRKHLDYVSRFYFQAQNDNDDLNDYLESLFENWSRAYNCDVTNRNNLRGVMRLFEAHKVIDGDVGIIKINNGKLQGIEGTLIAKPTMGKTPVAYEDKITDHGLILDKYGAVEKYVVNKFNKNGSAEYAKTVDAKNMLFDGYFGRFAQTRGISPFVSALASLQDCNEAIEYQLLKAKMHAMFGVAITSGDNASDVGDGFDYTDANTGSETDLDTTDYEFALKPGLKLGLKPGHKIDTIESKTPSQEFQNFSELMIAVALKSLDIPTTFWDSSKSSYSATKQDRAEYELSCKAKRERNYEIYHRIAEWKINQWISEGLFKKFKITSIHDLKYDFIPEGVPWLDEQSEVQASMLRIATGLSSRTKEAKRHNEDFRTIVKQLAREEKLATDSGATLAIGQPGQVTTRDEEGQANPANITGVERVQDKKNAEEDKKIKAGVK